MKRSILALFLIVFAFSNLSAQEMTKEEEKSPQELYDYHMNKRKTNNLAGFITLGGGFGMVIGGIAQNVNNCLFTDDCNDGSALMYIGAITSLSSIYFFGQAGNHKSKAKVQLKNGAVGLNRNIKYSGVSVSFTF